MSNRMQPERQPNVIARVSRRRWLQSSAVIGSFFACPSLTRARAEAPRDGKIRIGLISDVHQDVMHDGIERISAFVAAMQTAKADLIVNLGDFCVPHQRNDAFLAAWNQFGQKKMHVLGNHDTDGGYRREQALEYYGSPARYYSQDLHGLHLVVLDGNDPDGKRGYPCNVNDDQLVWLENDLKATSLPTLIFIHQPIDAFDQHVRSSSKVRDVLARANKEAGFKKVLLVFSGHAHLDYVKESDGIPHVQINSASYVWVSKKHPSYDDAILKAHPWIASTCPYADPLWALLTLDTESGTATLEGRESRWVGPTPWDIGIAEDSYQRSRKFCRPGISARRFQWS